MRLAHNNSMTDKVTNRWIWQGSTALQDDQYSFEQLALRRSSQLILKHESDSRQKGSLTKQMDSGSSN